MALGLWVWRVLILSFFKGRMRLLGGEPHFLTGSLRGAGKAALVLRRFRLLGTGTILGFRV